MYILMVLEYGYPRKSEKKKRYIEERMKIEWKTMKKKKKKRVITRLRESAGEAKKSLVREEGGLDMSTTPMAQREGFS